MSLRYRNKETGQIVAWSEIHSLDLPFHFSFFVFQYENEHRRNTLSGGVLNNTARILSEEDFLRTHEPVIPSCPTRQGKEGQIEACVFSKRRILQVLQEHRYRVMDTKSTYGNLIPEPVSSLTFSEIAQRTGLKEKFVRCMCVEMDEVNQLSVAGLDKCSVMVLL